MKRTYIKPAVEVVDLETKATCVKTSWNVDGGKNSDNRGHVFEEDDKLPDNYDPWNSENW